MEGKDGVPLRFPRPVMALIATGIAAISIGLSAVPASADQVRHQEWWLTSLDVTSAWSASQGTGVTVAVLNDGVAANQADLAGAVTAAPAVNGALVAYGPYAGEQGTPIASLIAGRGHGTGGGAGIIGVAPGARILSVPVTLPADDPELGVSSVAAAIPSAIAAGIRYAVSHGATVIDLPIDPGQATSGGIAGVAAAAGGSPAEQSAVSYALAHDVVLVAPAGDNYAAGDAANYPAAYPGVIAVGAFDSAFNKAPWSSHQSYITLTAAGAGVVAADNAGGYQTINSTSAASAVVAGVVALIRARYPSLTAADIRKALITTTLYHRADGLATGSGYGAVDADHAMAAAAAMATPPADRASAGAQPLHAPAPVPAPSATQGISSQILRAGELSAGLLLALLMLIGIYAAVGRRQRRRSLPVPAEWTHRPAQSRYPHAGGVDADRMVELFAAPAPVPALPPGRQGAGPAGVRSADEGLFAPITGRQGTNPITGWLAPDGPIAPASPTAAGDAGARPAHGPASRAVGRRPSVSGAPPWEPAFAPNSELPWAAPAAAPAVSGGLVVSGGHVGSGRHASSGDARGTGGNAYPALTGPASPAGAPGPAALPPAEQDRPRELAARWDTPGRASQPDWDTPGRASQPDWDTPGRASQPDWDTASGISQPDWSTPRRTGQPGWDRAARAGQLDRQAGPGPTEEYSPAPVSASPAAASSPGFRSPVGAVSPTDSLSPGGYASSGRLGPSAGSASMGGFGSAAESGPPGGFSSATGFSSAAAGSATGGFDYSQSGADPADRGGDFGALPPRLASSGLPVRQPRAARPASSAPLSPSGSLWEPAPRDGATDQGNVEGESVETGGGRPIFVWNPAESAAQGDAGAEPGWPT